MEERLNRKAIDDYSDEYASKVTARFFATQTRITGPGLRTLCPIEQVNLFTIRELFAAWKHEGQKLRSPFFDYSHPDVTDALLKFQNLLSNHISIAAPDFQPLLKKAVSQTLFLLLNPYDFFAALLDRLGQEVTQKEITEEVRYLRINRGPIEKFLAHLQQQSIPSLGRNEAFALLDHILEEESFAPEEIDGHLAQLSEVLPVQADHFYERPSPRPAAPATAQATRKFQSTESKVLADSLQRIERIKDSLTINQKFMFTKILFHGDFEIFSQAIDRLDSLDNLEQALAYLKQSYPEWDAESEEYEEFIDLVRKRFG